MGGAKRRGDARTDVGSSERRAHDGDSSHMSRGWNEGYFDLGNAHGPIIGATFSGLERMLLKGRARSAFVELDVLDGSWCATGISSATGMWWWLSRARGQTKRGQTQSDATNLIQDVHVPASPHERRGCGLRCRGCQLMVTDFDTLTGEPSKGGTFALRNAAAMQPPTGVPAKGAP